MGFRWREKKKKGGTVGRDIRRRSAGRRIFALATDPTVWGTCFLDECLLNKRDNNQRSYSTPGQDQSLSRRFAPRLVGSLPGRSCSLQGTQNEPDRTENYSSLAWSKAYLDISVAGGWLGTGSPMCSTFSRVRVLARDEPDRLDNSSDSPARESLCSLLLYLSRSWRARSSLDSTCSER